MHTCDSNKLRMHVANYAQQLFTNFLYPVFLYGKYPNLYVSIASIAQSWRFRSISSRSLVALAKTSARPSSFAACREDDARFNYLSISSPWNCALSKITVLRGINPEVKDFARQNVEVVRASASRRTQMELLRAGARRLYRVCIIYELAASVDERAGHHLASHPL